MKKQIPINYPRHKICTLQSALLKRDKIRERLRRREELHTIRSFEKKLLSDQELSLKNSKGHPLNEKLSIN
jgi:hypothetical protein